MRTLRSQRDNRNLLAEINVVPYIDVMLVLLVIFMITTPLLNQGVNVELPQARAESLAANKTLPLIVVVDKQGQYFLNTQNTQAKPLTAKQLVTRVAAEIQLAKQSNEKRAVLVKGDKAVAYGKVVHAMALLQYAGVPKVGLMTRYDEQNQ